MSAGSRPAPSAALAMRKQRNRATRGAAVAALLTALLVPAVPALATISFTDGQRQTAAELVEQLEDRHYSKRRYDDELASEHLDNFIDSLDGGRMFFTAADIADFEVYRTKIDDDLRAGRLDAGLEIFNRYHERLLARLRDLLDTLPERVAALDFTLDERYELDAESRPWAADAAELDERWRLQLKNQVLNLRLADKPEDEIIETLSRRYRNQLGRVEQYNGQDAFQIFANALTELYDPHTNYFSPRRSENFNISMRLSLEGIGAVLSSQDEYTRVARIVPAGPAAKQGRLQPSDRIVAVAQGDDGEYEDVIGWRLDEVVELIRGPKGSTVRLQVLPAKAGADAEREEIRIVRNEVKLEEQSAQKRIIEVPRGEAGEGTVRVGVIDIPTFYIDFEAMRRGDEEYKSTTRDVRRLLEELEEERVDGLIIDLRNNGGGSLQEANELTGLFIEYGPTVQIRHSSRRVWRDGKRLRSSYYDGPLLVMINRLSASASEIFAGAIQDYKRGLVVGDRSYGKGTVQTMVPLTEGQLKITESKFYRISGDSTQHRGVVPDITFPSLYDPEDIGESSLEHALSWDQINPVRHRRYGDLDPLIPELSALFQERSASDPDFNFLVDRVALADENDDIQVVSLNEETRRAEREAREARALAIENKRRQALGEEPLASFDDEAEDDEAGADDAAADGEEEEDEADVLLSEAGNILVDALLMRKQAYAIHSPEEE
jgi:carboxyl-terminal processing protease